MKKRVRKLSAYGTIVGPLFIGLVMILPQPTEILIMILLAVPLVAVFLTWCYRGILGVQMSLTRPYPPLVSVIVFTGVAAFLAVIRRYNIYRLDRRFWEILAAWSVVVFLIWAVACRAATVGKRAPLAIYAGMLLVSALYSFSALLVSNCEYDHHKEVIWRVKVAGKHYNIGGRSANSYYFSLSAWGRFADGKSVAVPYSVYRSAAVGDSANVYLHPGVWGIPWYEVMVD
jgi:hypothetical protein